MLLNFLLASTLGQMTNAHILSFYPIKSLNNSQWKKRLHLYQFLKRNLLHANYVRFILAVISSTNIRSAKQFIAVTMVDSVKASASLALNHPGVETSTSQSLLLLGSLVGQSLPLLVTLFRLHSNTQVQR